MTSGITYGNEIDGPVYLDIKSSDQAAGIFMNFVRDIVGYVPDDPVTETSDFQRVKAALVEYNAVYRFNQAKSGYVRKHFIRFGQPRDLTAFLMRYS